MVLTSEYSVFVLIRRPVIPAGKGSPAVLFNAQKGVTVLKQDVTTEIRLLKGNDVARMLEIGVN